jgi:GNAT superfamily N-acetyltransferase
MNKINKKGLSVEYNKPKRGAMELVECTQKYWQFVRHLRTDPRNTRGFICNKKITAGQQVRYMTKYAECYRIALLNGAAVGYVGVIDNDIRVCVHPDHHRQGVGRFLVAEVKKIWPDATAKIKVDNEASFRLFASCGFVPEYFILNQEE